MGGTEHIGSRLMNLRMNSICSCEEGGQSHAIKVIWTASARLHTIVQPPILAAIHNLAVVVNSDEILVSDERKMQT